jgi:hypothetical protein
MLSALLRPVGCHIPEPLYLKSTLGTRVSARTRLQKTHSNSFIHCATISSRRNRKPNRSNVGQIRSASSIGFWGSRFVWKRAGMNTFRCLVGCSLGDFSAMWFLQYYYPGLGIGTIMAISSNVLSDQIRREHPNNLR